MLERLSQEIASSLHQLFVPHPSRFMRYTDLLFFVTCFVGIAPVLAGPLPDAEKTGNNEQVDQILKSDVDNLKPGPQGETALHWMAFYGDEAMVRRLIAAGAGVNERLGKGSTPLHLAAYNGHTGVARLLIKQGASVNARTDDGITPLDWARRNGHTEVAQLLIAHAAKPGQGLSNDEVPAEQRKTGKVNKRTQASIPLPDLAKGSRQNGAAESLVANDANFDRTPSHDGTTTGHRRLRPEDLKYYPSQGWIATKVDHSQGPRGASSLTDSPDSKTDHPGDPPSAASFRVQLAAVSSEQRAAKAWTQYREQHPDILQDLELRLDTVSLRGKRLYRVQAGLFTRHDAQSVCDELKRRSQPCMVISADLL